MRWDRAIGAPSERILGGRGDRRLTGNCQMGRMTGGGRFVLHWLFEGIFGGSRRATGREMRFCSAEGVRRNRTDSRAKEIRGGGTVIPHSTGQIGHRCHGDR